MCQSGRQVKRRQEEGGMCVCGGGGQSRGILRPSTDTNPLSAVAAPGVVSAERWANPSQA